MKTQIRSMFVLVCLGSLCPASWVHAQDAVPEPPEPTFDLAEAIADGPTLTAEQAAQRAVSSAPELERARAMARASEAAVSRARAAMLPRLDLSASYQHVDGFPDGQIDFGTDPAALDAARMLAGTVSDPAARTLWLGQIDSQAGGGATIAIPRDRFGLSARLTWPVSDMFFAMLPALEAAEAGARSRDIEQEVTEAGVRRSALEAYYQLVRARGALAVSQEGLRTAESQQAQVEASVRAGFLTTADQMSVEARVAEARGAVASGRAGVSMADAGLRAIVGAEPGAVFGVALGGTSTVEVNQAQALEQRPELRAMREALVAQRSAARAQDAQAYPHLSLYAGADYANPNRYQIPPQSEFTGSWELGAMLTWSPNDTLGAVHRGDELGAQQAATEAQIAQIERTVRVQMAQAEAQLEAAHETLDAQRALVTSSEAAYESRVAQLRAGGATVADLLAAEARMHRARLGELDAEVSLRVAAVRLAHAAGAL